jgi:phage terminase large subunit-like protein
MLLSNVKDIERMAHRETRAPLHFESVLIITPGDLNGTSGWKMEPLHAVWFAEEPSAAGQVAEIYETTAGVKYARSMHETPIKELLNETLQFRFPSQGANRSNLPH